MLAEMEVTNNIIAVVLLLFGKKVFKVNKKYLRYHMQIFIKDLDPHSIMYLKKYELTSNAPVIQSRKLVCIISNYFSNLLPTGQVKIIHRILNKEETRLYTLIKSNYKGIDTVSQQQKSL